MKCAIHPDVDAAGYCRNCGKALCPACTREVRGMIYCESCLADMVTQPRAAAHTGANPALATLLGFCPGLGAVYNGEYTKAVVHVLIFAAFVGILSGDHPDAVTAVCGILLAAFILYMVIDAHRVAKLRQEGQPVPSVTETIPALASNKAVLPFTLIAIGILCLLSNFGLMNVDRLIDVWWPLILIIVGAGLAWRRMEGRR
jgi:hypothetical protein